MWTIIFFTSWQCSSFVMGNDDWLSHLSDESQPKCEKSPPKSSKNEKLIFILHSTSDDQPSDPSNKNQLKCKKDPLSHQKKMKKAPYVIPLMSLKNKMFVFGLCSTSDDWPNDLMFNFWWSAERSEWQTLTKMQNKKKKAPHVIKK